MGIPQLEANMLARKQFLKLVSSTKTPTSLRGAIPTTVTMTSTATFHSSPPRHELSVEHQKIVKSTAPVLAEHGVAITSHFYKRMLNNHPELRNVFNSAHQDTGTQPAALAHAVWAYASNIDNLGALTTAVSRIGHKHASPGRMGSCLPATGRYIHQL